MNLIAELEAEQIKALGKDIPYFAAGDTVPDRGRWGTVALAGGSAIAGTALAVAAEA